MLYPGRATVCVSSQAGCAMGCGFCATGQAGFDRHLTTGEIVEQVVRAAQRAKALGRRLSNVVFMGMGEPLANEERVWAAVERLHGDLGLSARSITISTVGIVPGIAKLARRDAAGEPRRVAARRQRPRSATSWCRSTAATRSARCSTPAPTTCAAKHRRLSFEWALIDGVNDRDADAAELAALCRPLPLAPHVNLIPLNPTPGWPTVGSPPARVRAFRDRLVALGVNATVRRNRGTDIDAACGQLAAQRASARGARAAPAGPHAASLRPRRRLHHEL